MKSIKLGEFHFKKVLEMLIEITYLAAFFVVPLVMAWFLTTDNVFELNKIIIFRVLTLVLFVLTLAKALFFPVRQKLSARYLWPVLGLILFGALSLFFSVDPANSYFGSNDRQQGYRSLLFYAWWFVLLFYNLVTAENLGQRINRIFWTVIGSSFLVSLYGILQILGIDFVSWTEPPFVTHRITSTLGQPNFLGSYLLLVIPLAVYGLIKYRNIWLRLFLSFSLLAQLIVLVLTGSRAAWLGLVGALFLFVIWNLRSFWVKLSAPRRRGVVLVSIFALLILVLSSVQSEYISGRVKGMFDFQGGSVSARFNFWSGALKSISQKPFMGYGLENQGTEFVKYYQADWAKAGFVNASTNRAHNLILDWLLVGGIIGLIFYLWVYVSFFKWANQNRLHSRYGRFSEALMLAVAACLISLLFGFPVVVTEVYFWSFLAIITAINAIPEEHEAGRDLKVNLVVKIIIMLLALVFTVRQIAGEFKALTADNYFWEMRQTIAQNNYPRALFYYQKIKEQNIHNSSYGYYLVDSLPYDLDAAFDPAIANLFRRELKDILPGIGRGNYDNYYEQAKIYTLLRDRDQADAAYQKIVALSPKLPKNYFARAEFYIAFGQDDLALADLEKTLTLLPPIASPLATLSSLEKSVNYYESMVYRELGNIYFRQQKYDSAIESYNEAYRHNLNDAAVYKKIADSYFMQGDLKTATWYNLRGAERHPNDYSWPLSVAILYQQQGQMESALKYLNQALALDFNKQIPAAVVEGIRQGNK